MASRFFAENFFVRACPPVNLLLRRAAVAADSDYVRELSEARQSSCRE
jgi:hypothetical protein